MMRTKTRHQNWKGGHVKESTSREAHSAWDDSSGGILPQPLSSCPPYWWAALGRSQRAQEPTDVVVRVSRLLGKEQDGEEWRVDLRCGRGLGRIWHKHLRWEEPPVVLARPPICLAWVPSSRSFPRQLQVRTPSRHTNILPRWQVLCLHFFHLSQDRFAKAAASASSAPWLPFVFPNHPASITSTVKWRLLQRGPRLS